jgi:hypothetical protein
MISRAKPRTNVRRATSHSPARQFCRFKPHRYAAGSAIAAESRPSGGGAISPGRTPFVVLPAEILTPRTLIVDTPSICFELFAHDPVRTMGDLRCGSPRGLATSACP